LTIFNWDFARQILPELLAASVVTIEITLVSFVVAIVVGLILAIMRRSKRRFLRWPVIGLIEFIRSTPLLVQLYVLYFLLPHVGLVLSPFLTGVIGLGMHYACYISEVFRSGIDSVPKGQWEAAVALNYSRFQSMRKIILPQAIPPIIPPLGNYLVAMFKDTPMLAAITVVELLYTANLIASEKFLYVEPMTLVGLLFLGMSLVASFGLRRLERRLVK
jgi:polar amino acid transport system permease protein